LSNGDQQECGADAEGGRVEVDLGAAEQLVAHAAVERLDVGALPMDQRRVGR